MHTPDIKCPYCGGDMATGTIHVRDSFWGRMWFGYSSPYLWFRTGEQNDIVLGSGEECAGHRCTQCDAVTLDMRTRRRTS